MNIWPYILRSGHTNDPSGGACAMDAVNWLVHGKHGDQPECACPVIAAFVMSGNDRMPDVVRQRLLPYLHRIAGSRSGEHEAARVRVLWLASVRVFTPMTLDEAGLHSQANILRGLHADISVEDAAKAASAASAAAWVAWEATVEAATAEAATAEAEAASTVSWVAAAASEILATSTAVWAANTAVWATSTAAWATAAAASAASASRTAAAAATATKKNLVWDAYFAVLDEALNAGPQGEPWSADTLRAGTGLYQAAGGLVAA